MSHEPRPPTATRSRVPLVAAALVFLVLAVRRALFVRHYAIDVLFWDSWDLYQPLFRRAGWWATFDQQHGPHRQGLGGLLIRAVAQRTGWDTRYDAAEVLAALIAAVPLGVLLAWRCGVRGWALVAVPVVYLNARQYQMFVAAANPAHAALPVLLLTALALAWFARRTGPRLCLIVGLTTGCLFTGFGMLVAPLALAVLTLEGWQAVRTGDRRRAVAVAAAVAGTVVALIGFALNYRFDPASSRFHFPFERPEEYLYFIGAMLGNDVGVDGAMQGPGPGTIGVGLAVAAAGMGVAITRGASLVRRGVASGPADVALFLLSAFGVMFAVNAAIGRTPEGWNTGASSRYVTACIPTGLAILLHLATIRRWWAQAAALAGGGLLAFGTVGLYPSDLASIEAARAGCLRWRAAYLATHDVAAANRASRFAIYAGRVDPRQLQYLEANQLNMFDPGVFGPVPTPAPHIKPPGTGGR